MHSSQAARRATRLSDSPGRQRVDGAPRCASAAGRRWGGALALVLAGGALLACAATPDIRRELDPLHARRLSSTMTMMMLTSLLLLVFVVAAYLLLRFGRAFKQPAHRRERTPYVDAWAQARVSDDELAAWREPPDSPAGGDADERDGPPSDEPRDEPPRR
ncbi:MAG: hypothetical protein AB7Q17_08220 [Phycisphaerae bacterium]